MRDVGMICQHWRIHSRHGVAGKAYGEKQGGVTCRCVSSDSSPPITDKIGLLAPWGSRNPRKPQRHHPMHTTTMNLTTKKTLPMRKAAGPRTRRAAPPPTLPSPPCKCSLSQARWVWPLQPSAPYVSTNVLHKRECEHKTGAQTWTPPTNVLTMSSPWTIDICDDMPTPHHITNLAMLQGGVNWHLHCCCEVFQLVLGMYPHTGCIPPGFCRTCTHTHWNPYPWARESVAGAKVVVMGWVEDEQISTVMGLIWVLNSAHPHR